MNHNYPRICVIVLNYFDYAGTKRCVSSLIGQKFDTLYLVDNSGDQQEAKLTYKIKSFLEQQNISFEIELLVNLKNLGFGSGINAAIKTDRKKSGGHDYYLLLNNDAVLTERTIERLVKKCIDNPNIALASPLIEWAGRPVRYYGYNKLFGHVTSTPTPYAQPYLSGCCLLADKILIDDSGKLFDEDFFMYGEDIELNWRAKKLGKKICCVDEITIFHEGTGSSKHGEFFYEYHVARGHFLLGVKARTSENRISIYSISRVLYLSVRAAIRVVRYRNFAPLIATYMAFRHVLLK